MKYFIILLFFVLNNHAVAFHSTLHKTSTSSLAVERPPVSKKKHKTVRQKKVARKARIANQKVKRKSQKHKRASTKQTTNFNPKIKLGLILYGIVILFVIIMLLILPTGVIILTTLSGFFLELVYSVFFAGILSVIGLGYTLMGLHELPAAKYGLGVLGILSTISIFIILMLATVFIFTNSLAAIICLPALIIAIAGLIVSAKSR